jgi:hypothetical protein
MKLVIIEYVRQIPMKTRYGLGAYFAGVCLYAVSGSYQESKRCLLQYRQNATMKMNKKVATIDGKEFDDEWKVVKYGAYKNFCERFWNALIFPFNVCIDAVPYAVLWLNSGNKPKPE